MDFCLIYEIYGTLRQTWVGQESIWCLFESVTMHLVFVYSLVNNEFFICLGRVMRAFGICMSRLCLHLVFAWVGYVFIWYLHESVMSSFGICMSRLCLHLVFVWVGYVFIWYLYESVMSSFGIFMSRLCLHLVFLWVGYVFIWYFYESVMSSFGICMSRLCLHLVFGICLGRL